MVRRRRKGGGHSMGNMTGSSVRRISADEYEATVRFANGVEGTGRGRTRSDAQKEAVEDARSKGGIGKWVVLALVGLAIGVPLS